MGIKKNLFCLFLFAAVFGSAFLFPKISFAVAPTCTTNADCGSGGVCDYCFCVPAPGYCGSGVGDPVQNGGTVNVGYPYPFNGHCLGGTWYTVHGGYGCATNNTACSGTTYRCENSTDQCVNNVCVCPPSCSGKSCGQDNGCGSPCQTGACPTNYNCSAGQCVSSCTSNASKGCYSNSVYWYNSCNVRGDVATTCTSSQNCSPTTLTCVDSCTPANDHKGCYSNSVYWYNSCNVRGDVVTTCTSSQNCSPTTLTCVSNSTCSTCASLNYPCGPISDGCGGTLNCSACASGWTCQNNQCIACTANSSKSCSSGDVYWYDSCGNLGLRYAVCGSGCVSGACVTTASCTANYSKRCDGGNLYWYDSCGVKGDLAQNCGSNSVTANYQCSGNWIQQGMVVKDCVSGVCTQNQTWSNTQDCSKSGKTCKNGVCVANDTVPPTISRLLPPGTVYSAGVALAATTNEPADCRYSSSDKTFDAMTLSFGSSDKLYHSASVSLPKYASYIYYVRCRDVNGNADLASSKISFRYASATAPVVSTAPAPPADVTPPVISDLAPSGQVNVATITISANTDEKATCKYDIADTGYDSMANVMDSASGGTSQSKSITLPDFGNYDYYIRCKDVAGNKNSSSAKISLVYSALSADGPVISNLLPPSGTVYQKNVTLFVSTDKTAECRWSPTDQEFDAMTESFSTQDGQSQQATVVLDGDRQYNYYVRCKDSAGVEDKSSSVISLTYQDPEPIQDSGDQPVGAAGKPPAAESSACASYKTADSDNECDNAANCVCDPDCGQNGRPEDPDCAHAAAGNQNNNAWMIAIPVAILILAIIIVIIVAVKKRKNGDDQDGIDEADVPDVPDNFG